MEVSSYNNSIEEDDVNLSEETLNENIKLISIPLNVLSKYANKIVELDLLKGEIKENIND